MSEIVCDTPGCGRPIPKGGEGHPEICPKCLNDLQIAERYAAGVEAGRKMGRAEVKEMVIGWLARSRLPRRNDVRALVPVAIRRRMVNALFDT